MTEELCDVLDEQGNKTGQALPKSKVHDRELWHGVAFIWIYNSAGELLLQLRSADKKLYANIWDVSVGGHISAGDTPLVTAIREAQEELGITVDASALTYLGQCKDQAKMITGKMHPEHAWIFLLHLDIAKEQLSLQASEVTNAKWIPIEQIEADLQQPNWTQNYAGRNKFMYDSAISEVHKRISNDRK